MKYFLRGVVLIFNSNLLRFLFDFAYPLLFASASLLAPALPEVNPVSLQGCFKAALKQSELIKQSEESIRQAEEHSRQAFGAILPSVNAVAGYSWQQPLTSSSTNIFPNEQPILRLSATQPIFRGLREYAAMRQTDLLAQGQTQSKRNAERLLFIDVAQNFYQVVSTEQDLKNLIEQIELYHKRAVELKARVAIGRSRLSEHLTIEAAIAGFEAQVEQVKGQLQVAREMGAFLTGLHVATPLVDQENVPEKPAPLEEYLSRVDFRPDIRSARSRLGFANEEVRIARGGHLPSVDLNGNYYFVRNGALKDVHWDAQLLLTIPLFAGGLIQSRLREAVSLQTQAELEWQRLKRLAAQELRTLYLHFETDRSQLASLRRSTAQAEKNYQQQSGEYRLGLVNNLEVLSALALFQEGKRTLDRVRFQMRSDYVRLEIAAGKRVGH